MSNEKESLPVFSTSRTGGLTSILQLTDDTPNEVFTIRHSTSGTETIILLETPSEEDSIKENEED